MSKNYATKVRKRKALTSQSIHEKHYAHRERLAKTKNFCEEIVGESKK